MKKEIKIVVGANYGDEGKGLVTSYLAQEAARNNKKILNVLYNGSCQRGHTVDIDENIRHVFHHFGSGTLSGADTYFDKDFMVNPIIFNEEYAELQAKFLINPVSYVHPECRFVTPYDMILNQIIEEQRGNNRHGSCGYGVYECKKRYEFGGDSYFIFSMIPDSDKREYLNSIRDIYLPNRLKELGYSIPEKWKTVIEDDGIIEQYLIDFKRMNELCKVRKMLSNLGDDTRDVYDTIIFEAGQGLALDEDNMNDFPNLTPSHTGSFIPVIRMIESGLMKYETNICYVTRSYFTRHGAGIFPTECDISEINENIVDETNVYNDFQHGIRYGKFDFESFLLRVTKDFSKSLSLCTVSSSEDSLGPMNLFVTHLNYTNGEICGNTSLNELSRNFKNVYISDTKYAKDIKHFKEV